MNKWNPFGWCVRKSSERPFRNRLILYKVIFVHSLIHSQLISISSEQLCINICAHIIENSEQIRGTNQISQYLNTRNYIPSTEIESSKCTNSVNRKKMSTIMPTAMKIDQFIKYYTHFEMPEDNDNAQGAFKLFLEQWKLIKREITIYTNKQWKIDHIDLVNEASILAERNTMTFKEKMARMKDELTQKTNNNHHAATATLSLNAPEFIPHYRRSIQPLQYQLQPGTSMQFYQPLESQFNGTQPMQHEYQRAQSFDYHHNWSFQCPSHQQHSLYGRNIEQFIGYKQWRSM